MENAKGLKCGSGSQRARRRAGSHHEDAERILSTSPAELCAFSTLVRWARRRAVVAGGVAVAIATHWPGSGRVATSANANSPQSLPISAIGSIGLNSSGLWGLVFHLFGAETGVDPRSIFIKSIRCRARKTILSPALMSPRHRPQAQRHVERINAQGAPESQFAELVLQRVTTGAERKGITVRRLYSCAAVGSRAHMRGL